MAREDIELRLHGLPTPDGTISLGDLAPLAEALQLLATRIARDLGGQAGPGRTARPLEDIARPTLGEVRRGSTRLLSAGDDTLAIDHPLETDTFDRLWEVVGGLDAGRRPEWVTPAVAEAAIGLANALGPADDVEFLGQRAGRPRPRVRVAAARVDRAVWRMDSEPARRSGVTVTGILDLVDLRRRTFRIRDDVGHDISLDDVEHATEAGALVGSRVAANGEAVLGSRGQPVRIRSAIVTGVAVPAAWAVGRDGDGTARLTRVLADASSAPGPLVGGIDGITDEAVDEFLTNLRG